jgi:putative flippase GtrA
MPLAPPSTAASAVLRRLPEPVRRRVCSVTGRRMARFAPAAMVALAASQLAYFLGGNVWHLTGRVTGAAGWLAGAAVSYVVSRWAWERRGRPRFLRETLPFVAISAVNGPVLIEASHFGYREAGALGLHGVAFHAFTQGFYLAANGVTFIVRFVIFNFVVFADRTAHRQLASSLPQVRLGRVVQGRFWRLVAEFASFSVVWVVCAWLVSGAVFSLLSMQAGVKPQTSAMVGVAVATVASFAGNRYWTFRQRQRTTVHGEGFRYLVLTGAGLMLQLDFVRLTIRSLGPDTAPMLGLGLSILFCYWSCRTCVWRAPASAPAIVA